MIRRKNAAGTWDLISGSDTPINNLTSTEIDKPLSAKQGKELQDKKLSLTGGTMTGVITTTHNDLAKQAVDSTFLEVFGGTGAENGGYVKMYGKECTGSQGYVDIVANNGTNATVLSAHPSGSLYWGGNKVCVGAPAAFTADAVSGMSTGYNALRCYQIIPGKLYGLMLMVYQSGIIATQAQVQLLKNCKINGTVIGSSSPLAAAAAWEGVAFQAIMEGGTLYVKNLSSWDKGTSISPTFNGLVWM